MKLCSVLVLLCLFTVGFASASVTANMNGTPVTVGVNDYQYNYSITVDPGQQLAAGSYQSCVNGSACGTFFTIYNFEGYLNNTLTAPTGWSGIMNLTGSTVAPGQAGYSSVVDNLLFTYNGSPSNLSDLPVSGFSAQSIYNSPSATSAGRYSYTAGGAFNFGNVATPLAIPEPASLALIGSGLIGLAILRRRLAR